MITTNTWEGGLDQDSAKLLRKQNTYTDANNIRLTTIEGESNLALTNIKGNRLFDSIPDAPNVFKVIAGSNFDGTLADFQITVNSTVLNINIPKTLSALNDAINDYVGFENYSSYLSEDESYLLVTSHNGTALNTFNVTITGASVTITTFLTTQTDLVCIGYTKIRDEVYLITTNETAKVPLSTGGIGQIWRVTYTDISVDANFTLLYNNYMNLTTYHVIPPTAIQGRYENSFTKRLYWTDNFNEIRSFNVSNPNGFALSIDLLSLQAAVDASIPILKSIGTGTLQVGEYQCSYRLKNDSAVTVWSELSNQVFIAKSSVSENQITSGVGGINYIGAIEGTAANKSITWTIENLDTDYQRIEILVFKRAQFNGTPEIILTHDEPINSNGTIEFTYDGTQNLEVATLSDFFTQVFSFTHCKTLAVKDNQLIAGNVRHSKIDFEYDARAYRFPTSSTTLELTNAGATNSYPITTSDDYNNIEEDNDAINPDQSVNANYYQINSTTIGGTGPNISYTFGTYSIKADTTTELVALPGTSPFMHTNPNFNVDEINLGVTGQDYPINGQNDGLKFAYRSGLLKTYQRNEVYRFAIVFYDKQYRALFARWIGDIRMPDYEETNPNPDAEATAASISDFRLTFQGSIDTNEYWIQLLYPEFTVTIPEEIRQYIGGFRIVRVDRTKTDKTILGAGLVTVVQSNGAADLLIPDHHTSTTLTVSPDLNLTGEGRANNQGSDLNFMFDSPDFLLTGFDGNGATDKLVISATLSKANSTTDIQPSAGADPYRIIKEYGTHDLYDFANNQYDIEEVAGLDSSQRYTFTGTSSTGWSFNNYTRTTANTSAAIGSKTYILGLSDSLLHATNYDCTNNSYRKMYGLYYRPLTTQYGGNTFSARSRNNYMPCGSFQPINVNTNPTTTTFTQKVFGGDTVIDIYDNQKLIKNWGQTSRGQYSGAGVAKNSFTYFFPVESSHNMNLRHGIRMSKDLQVNAGASGEGFGASVTETYDYNTVYSQQNNLVTYVPKPLDFQAVEDFDTRIWVSRKKQDGELEDSWTVFPPSTFQDADNMYGPINALISFEDRIYFFQSNAFGIAPISERVVVNDNSLSDLQIGTSTLTIQRPEYLSKVIGSKHQWSILSSKRALYFFDITTKQLYMHSGQGTRIIPGLNKIFKNKLIGKVLFLDNQIYSDPDLTDTRSGIHGTVDYKNNDVIYTVFDGQFIGDGTQGPVFEQYQKTFVYNEDLNVFSTFIDCQPYIYINDTINIITPNPESQQELHVHNEGNYGEFYGTVFDSTVSPIVNENAKFTKVFTNMEWDSQVTQILSAQEPINILNTTFSSFRISNDYQNTDYIPLSIGTIIRRRERTWKAKIPRNRVNQVINTDIFDSSNLSSARLFKEPMRDKHILIDLIFSNEENYRLICPYFNTEYLISPR